MKKNLNLCHPSSRARLATIIRWLCVTLATILPVPHAALVSRPRHFGASAPL